MSPSVHKPGREIWVRLLLYPGHTLPTAAAPVAVGAGLAWRDGVFAPAPVLLGLLGSWLIHVGGVFADNLELLRRHPQVREHPELLAAVAEGSLSLRGLSAATFACFLLALLPAPWLVARGGWPVVWIGVAGIVASHGYAGRGITYAKRGLADVVFLLMFGVVAVVATWWIQAAPIAPSVPPDVFLLGTPVGALVVCVLVIDDIRDRDHDRAKGWRTPTVRFGLRFARTEFTVLVVFAYLVPVVCWLAFGMSAWALCSFATLPFALAVTRAVWRFDTTEALLRMSPRMSKTAFAFACLFAIGIARSPASLA
ncbi:MAG: UbiA family prenyltransferase [Planctomycetota bacterium]